MVDVLWSHVCTLWRDYPLVLFHGPYLNFWIFSEKSTSQVRCIQAPGTAQTVYLIVTNLCGIVKIPNRNDAWALLPVASTSFRPTRSTRKTFPIKITRFVLRLNSKDCMVYGLALFGVAHG